MSILLYESLSLIIKWVFTPPDRFCTSTVTIKREMVNFFARIVKQPQSGAVITVSYYRSFMISLLTTAD